MNIGIVRTEFLNKMVYIVILFDLIKRKILVSGSFDP